MSDGLFCQAKLLPCLYLGPDGPTEFAGCLELKKTGELQVVSRLLPQLPFDEKGLAIVREKDLGWMYVNKKGIVIISGVASMDNWADSFHDGLVRFSRVHIAELSSLSAQTKLMPLRYKWGFADTNGKEVVPPIYDGSLNFENGIAKVCVGCRSEKESPDSEYHNWTGGRWTCINTRGETVTCSP